MTGTGDHSAPSRAHATDTALLLTWLDNHSTGAGTVRYAVLQGLAARIRRGDFTTQDGEA